MKKLKNDQKKDKKSGKKQACKINLVFDKKYYLEAIWMLSSELEKKLKKQLLNLENINPGSGYNLEQSIKRVKHLHRTLKYPLFSDHFDVGLIDAIRNWKNQRNSIFKDMQDVHVSQARLEKLAGEGIGLLEEWNKANRKFKSEME
ncbi:MAG: hypothetical protein WCK34_05055 [Bacteroidota bacterium]